MEWSNLLVNIFHEPTIIQELAANPNHKPTAPPALLIPDKGYK